MRLPLDDAIGAHTTTTGQIVKTPKKTKADAAHSMVKAAFGSVPVIGAGAAELMSSIITAPFEKRKMEWIESIAERVKQLEEKIEGITSETLAQNDSFVTAVLEAGHIAVRTHQEEKLEALRNAVINTALPSAPSDDLQSIFINYVADLTPWHLRVLAFFSDPTKWGETHRIKYPNWTNGAPSTVLEHTFPELRGNRDFYILLTRDLDNRGLMDADSILTTMTRHGMFSPRTKPLGGEFITFITNPFV